jgi:hypothetical protein
MKKSSTFFLVCLFLLAGNFSTFATVYLVENGSGGNSWRASGAGETNIILATANAGSAYTLTAWLSATTFETGDQVWLAKGTYNVSTAYAVSATLGAIYGGFAGSETAPSERAKGTNAWDFTNETIVHSTFTTIAGFTGSEGRSIIFDGLTMNAFTNAITQKANMHIQSCKFTNNTSGAVSFFNSGSTSTKDSYFYNNRVSGTSTNGAAVTINTTSSATYELSGCLFENNTSTATGNGNSACIRLSGTAFYVANISNCVFKNNKNTGSGTPHTSIISMIQNNPTLNVINCLGYGDVADPSNAEAIYLQKGNIINSTFVNNYKGAHLNPSTGSIVFRNTVFWGTVEDGTLLAPGAITTAGTTANIRLYNCAYRTVGVVSNDTLAVVLPPTNASGTNAPYFTDPATNDWTIGTGSSLKDAGTDAGAPATDLLGTSRPQGGSFDIGAYEMIVLTTGLNNVNSEINTLTLERGAFISNFTGNVQVYTITGQQLKNTTVSNGDKISLSSGIYVVRSSSEKGSSTQKVIL